MSLHRNRVQMTVTGTPGTGTITLNAATSGYQSFSSAYGADATVDILITEGTSWEVARNCTYTNSGTTVTRGTLEASSTGSAVSFTSSAIVSVIATAASGNNWGLNEISASPTGAGVTGVVGTLHILDISGLTADQDFTLPATCAVGDRVGVFIKTGDPDYELLLKPASGDTINGGSPAAEWSRLFITGECVIFRCITANTDWIVEYDGRIPCVGNLRITTAESGTKTGGVFYAPTALSAVWTADENIGNAMNTTNSRYVARRKALVQLSASALAGVNGLDTQFITVQLNDGTTNWGTTRDFLSTTGALRIACAGAVVLAAGSYIQFETASSVNNIYIGVSTRFNVVEIL